MAWAYMAVSGLGSQIYVDDITHDGGSRINSEVYRYILEANAKINKIHTYNLIDYELFHAASPKTYYLHNKEPYQRGKFGGFYTAQINY